MGSALTSCSDSKPAICGHVSDLKKTVQNLGKPEGNQTTVQALSSDLNEVQRLTGLIVQEAKQQYAPQVDSLKTAATGASAAANAAKANPSASTLTSVASAVSNLVTATQNLATAVSGTC